MTNNESPFIPGTDIGIVRWSEGVIVHLRRDKVAKVHKNGNFTLQSDLKQQYQVRSHYDATEHGVVWSARETGNNFSRNSIKVWDAKFQTDVDASTARRDLRQKLSEVKHAVSAIFSRTDNAELVDALAAVLASAALKGE